MSDQQIKNILTYTENPQLQSLIKTVYGNIDRDLSDKISLNILFQVISETIEKINTLKKINTQYVTIQSYKFDNKILHSESNSNKDKSRDDALLNEKSYEVLEIITQDMPFVLSTLNNMFNKIALKPIFVIHPIILAKYNDKGDLQEVSPIKENALNRKTTNSVILAVIQFYFEHGSIQNNSQLIEKIKEILQCIKTIVSDLPRIRETLEHSISLFDNKKIKENEKCIEAIHFINWLLKDNFTFLGSVESQFQNNKLISLSESKTGIMRGNCYKIEDISEIHNYEEEGPIFVRRSNITPIICQDNSIDYIHIKKWNNDGKLLGFITIAGFFPFYTYYKDISNIPIISNKIKQVLALYNQPEDSFNVKALYDALRSFTITELLQIDYHLLYKISLKITYITLTQEFKIFINKDRSEQFANCLIFIPKKYFSTKVKEAIESILCQQLNGKIVEDHIVITEAALVRLNVVVAFNDKSKGEYNVKKIEKLLSSIINEWENDLELEIKNHYNEESASAKITKYKNVFCQNYVSYFTVKETIKDIEMMEMALQKGKTKFLLYTSNENPDEIVQLKIYSSDHGFNISSILYMVENFGFISIDMASYHVKVNAAEAPDGIYIHHLTLEHKDATTRGALTPETRQNIEIALEKIKDGTFDNDGFNSLILYSGASWSEVFAIRAYSSYLKQIKFQYSSSIIINSLLNNRKLVQKLIYLFNQKFNLQHNTNDKEIKKINEDILSALNDVKDIADDRVIRMYYELINATKRTNYLNIDSNDYISFKIASSEITKMPLPKPFMEIYVYSTRFEAIHLRGGRIARGGIRWSDRAEDFRTEVLGLMKAQMTKNVIIVPVGSKGGFLIKKREKENYMEDGIECYKLFLNAILDITDNIISGKVVKPKNVRCYDQDDPYLVVAADKGTATFSDYANEISAKHNYWLGDAFASGGSAGYDHKEMGITSRGAWISVKQHFKQLQRNIETHPFTVIGIGDMSGDVFGNGMLLSRNIKLIAAFNHKHIFIDPTPDTAKSFAERERLFKLRGSQWSDYNKDLISVGGGVFERKSKSIQLSKEAIVALGIEENVTELTPDDLINTILKAPVDLLWNGGIGTYVKATYESHEMVEDKANDALRVNGSELRCKVVGEGGNLGFTQAGRIEYARNGGKINTDFIDNSAGVDCSDHEVNIKIAFGPPLLERKITLDERNKILAEMQDNVASLVLNDNFEQTQLMSVEEYFTEINFDKHIWLIRFLEMRKELNREVEGLPDEQTILRLKSLNLSLTRPELAVLIAYAKNTMSKILENLQLDNDTYFLECLLNYFPQEMREKYHENILNHQLRNDIIRTFIVNDFINIMGISSFHQIMNVTNAIPLNIIKAFIIAKEGLGLGSYWKKIQSYSMEVMPFATQTKLLVGLQRMIEKNIYLLITSWHKRHLNKVSITSLIEKFKKQTEELLKLYKDGTLADIPIISSIAVTISHIDVPIDIASEIRALPVIANMLEISFIAEDTEMSVENVSKIYYDVCKKLKINLLYDKIGSKIVNDYYDQIAIKLIVQDISLIISKLIKNFVIHLKDNENAKLTDMINDEKLKDYYTFVNSIDANHSSKSLISLLVILQKHIKSLSQKS